MEGQEFTFFCGVIPGVHHIEMMDSLLSCILPAVYSQQRKPVPAMTAPASKDKGPSSTSASGMAVKDRPTLPSSNINDLALG